MAENKFASLNTDALKELYRLWTIENSIANQKVAQFLTSQPFLALGFIGIANWGRSYRFGMGFLGFVISCLWWGSLYRTAEYRDFLKHKIDKALGEASPEEADEWRFFRSGDWKEGLDAATKIQSQFFLVVPAVLGALMWGFITLRQVFR